TSLRTLNFHPLPSQKFFAAAHFAWLSMYVAASSRNLFWLFLPFRGKTCWLEGLISQTSTLPSALLITRSGKYLLFLLDTGSWYGTISSSELQATTSGSVSSRENTRSSQLLL